ncbi:MAG: GAF domain-containing protein, partial [candidate division NC10 bacterium]|nr:GAF domain-containing protein [candidate division NC10 bacterium]
MFPHTPAEQRLEELSLLYDAWRAISATLDLGRLSELIARTAATTLRAGTALLRLADSETGELRVASRFDADGGAPCAAADGPVAEAVRREAAPILLPDLRQDARFAALAGSEGAPALCAPLVHQGSVRGTLGVYGRLGGAHGEPATFGEADLTLLMAFSAQAAVAIENA